MRHRPTHFETYALEDLKFYSHFLQYREYLAGESVNLRVGLNIFLKTVSAKKMDANRCLGDGMWGCEKTRLITFLPRVYEKI